jgi:hypothetical protein
MRNHAAAWAMAGANSRGQVVRWRAPAGRERRAKQRAASPQAEGDGGIGNYADTM